LAGGGGYVMFGGVGNALGYKKSLEASDIRRSRDLRMQLAGVVLHWRVLSIFELLKLLHLGKH